jgi:hypothetical protein
MTKHIALLSAKNVLQAPPTGDYSMTRIVRDEVLWSNWPWKTRRIHFFYKSTACRPLRGPIARV